MNQKPCLKIMKPYLGETVIYRECDEIKNRLFELFYPVATIDEVNEDYEHTGNHHDGLIETEDGSIYEWQGHEAGYVKIDAKKLFEALEKEKEVRL